MKNKGKKENLENFKEGIIDGMVAIKCLDEGIDVPACKTAYILASSKNPREFIQRRGRVLRKFDEIGKTEAYIHDFISIIPMNSKTSSFGREIQKEEFKRVYEFRNNSLNRNEAREELLDIANSWGLRQFYDQSKGPK